MVLTYVDDCIIVGNSTKEIDDFIKSLKGRKEDFILTDEGIIDKFLGVDIVDRGRGEFEMTQPHKSFKVLHLETPALNAMSMRRKLSKILFCSTEISMVSLAITCGSTANWDARLSASEHKEGHLHAVHASTSTPSCPTSKQFRIGRYLGDTSNRGIIYKPDELKA